jgi:Dockerin type I domain
MQKSAFITCLLLITVAYGFISSNAQTIRTSSSMTTAGAGSELVYLIVSSNLYNHQPINIQNSLQQYIQDLQQQGCQVEIVLWNDTLNGIGHAAPLRQFLLDAFLNENLDGAVLIGDIPYVEYYQCTWQGIVYGYPIDLYYRDLNGVWADTSGNGILDVHRAGVSSEIWVGRIYPLPLLQAYGNGTDEEEIAAINSYFLKNHAFRIKDISTSIGTVARKGLLYSNGYAVTGGNWLRLIYDEVEEVYNENTTMQNYITLLDNSGPGFESIVIGNHGAGSVFADGLFHVEEILQYDPKTVFVNIHSCEPQNFERNLPGTAYVFAPTNGLTTLGPSNWGVSADVDFYFYLSQGYSIGASLREWGIFNEMMDQNYGTTILGDPLLVLPNSDWVSNHTLPQRPAMPQASPNTIGYPGKPISFSLGPASLNSSTFRANWDDGTFSSSVMVQEGESAWLNHAFSEDGIYFVRAQVKGQDSALSSWSVPLQIIITSPLPSAPQKAIIYTSENASQLHWTPVVTNVMGYPLSQPQGYKIYRRNDEGSPWGLVGQVPSNTMSYQDSNVTPGFSYQYAITALANDNHESAFTPAVAAQCGDVNLDGRVNILDISMLIEYLYKSHKAPPIAEMADVNNTIVVNVLDITFLINNLYKGGPVPPEKIGYCHTI